MSRKPLEHSHAPNVPEPKLQDRGASSDKKPSDKPEIKDNAEKPDNKAQEVDTVSTGSGPQGGVEVPKGDISDTPVTQPPETTDNPANIIQGNKMYRNI
jgi:hypothetical protein